MAKVILIYPPVYYHGQSPVVLDVSYPPLGILYLAAVLEKEGISVRVIDVGAENQTLPVTLRLIGKEKPIVVGISAMTPVLQGAVTLAEKIKETFAGKVRVALGGPHISADPDFIRRFPEFDFGVGGEGEKTFTNLVKKLMKDKPVKGIFAGEAVQNIDDIPWPARHLVNLKRYLKRASLMAGRGCPFNCYYCSRPAVSKLIRYRDPKDVVAEMEWLYRFCEGDYLFQDDTFTIKREHTLAFCEEILKGKKKFHWAAYTRIDLVDEPLLKMMSRAGCHSLTFGIESGNEKIRNQVVKKKFSNSRIKEVIKQCLRWGIDTDGFFMLGHPGETEKEVEDTLNFILENDFNIVGVSIATPFPGSELWQYAVADKIMNFDLLDRFARGELGQGYAGVYPVYHPQNLSLPWLYQKRREVMRRFYLRPTYIVKRLLKDFSSFRQLKTDLIEGINILWRGSSARAPYQKEVNV